MARLRSLARKARTLGGVGHHRRALVIEAAASMFSARVRLLVFPFSKIARTLGAFVPPSDPRVAGHAEGATADQVKLARDIGWAVRASAPFMPFRSVCLQQAMAAQVMLRRRGIATVMHFGAGRGDEKPIDAHAWLDAAGVKVTGYPIAPNLAEIGCFV
ncbi:lasso peptide biosynthesis B2 protein [Sphingomonas alpina]|uniref:Lasso peptide biosynthesis B2 protein n=1 Tax=Sphingomonas alpina TaxID=653931 RepID=A0A7H0LPN5_9SPHN|nr:lasso peptide biosynthesis B2 protein [Sphingomonas alpina]QNQ11638.1 lasso peptide biosynthesis B2 protein [Sphingomonas alpina]